MTCCFFLFFLFGLSASLSLYSHENGDSDVCDSASPCSVEVCMEKVYALNEESNIIYLYPGEFNFSSASFVLNTSISFVGLGEAGDFTSRIIGSVSFTIESESNITVEFHNIEFNVSSEFLAFQGINIEGETSISFNHSKIITETTFLDVENIFSLSFHDTDIISTDKLFEPIFRVENIHYLTMIGVMTDSEEVMEDDIPLFTTRFYVTGNLYGGVVVENSEFYNLFGGTFLFDDVYEETTTSHPPEDTLIRFSSSSFKNCHNGFYIDDDRDPDYGTVSSVGGAVGISGQSTSNIRNLLIDNCDFVGNYANKGGAVYVNSTSFVTIRNCNVTQNYATHTAGGIYIKSNSSVIENTVFKECRSTEMVAGLYADVSGDVVVHNCTFEGNSADYFTSFTAKNANNVYINHTDFKHNEGGTSVSGVLVLATSNVVIYDSSFIENRCPSEVSTLFLSDVQNVVIEESHFDGNLGNLGSGMCTYEVESVTVRRSRFQNHQSLFGGVFVSMDGPSLSMVFEDVEFYNNTASLCCGGVGFIVGAGGSVVFDNCRMWDNSVHSSQEAEGGGVIFAANMSIVHVLNSVIEGNFAGDGGSFYLSGVEDVVFRNSTFMGNEAERSGGVVFFSNYSGPTDNFLVDGCLIEGNVASTERGGFITSMNLQLENILIIDTTISNNQAINQFGGAIYLESATTLTLQDVILTNNVGNAGGGVAINVGIDEIYVRNTTIRDNVAMMLGGAFHIINPRNVFFETCACSGNMDGILAEGSAGSTISIQSASGNVSITDLTILDAEKTREYGEIKIQDSNYVHFKNLVIDSVARGVLAIENHEMVFEDCLFTNMDSATVGWESPMQFQNTYQPEDTFITRGITMKNVTFEDCRGVKGGSIFLTDTNLLRVDSSKFIRNEALDRGGAIYCEGTLYMSETIEYSIGESIFTEDINFPGFNVTNSIFEHNFAPAGGSIFVQGTNAIVWLENNTFYNGSAEEYFDVYLEDSIFASVSNCDFIESQYWRSSEDGEVGKLGKCDLSSEPSSEEALMGRKSALVAQEVGLLVKDSRFVGIDGSALTTYLGSVDVWDCEMEEMSGRGLGMFGMKYEEPVKKILVFDEMEHGSVRNLMVRGNGVDMEGMFGSYGGGILATDFETVFRMSNVTLMDLNAEVGAGIYFNNIDSMMESMYNLHFLNCNATVGGGICYTDDQFVSLLSDLEFLNCDAEFGPLVLRLSNVTDTEDDIVRYMREMGYYEYDGGECTGETYKNSYSYCEDESSVCSEEFCLCGEVEDDDDPNEDDDDGDDGSDDDTMRIIRIFSISFSSFIFLLMIFCIVFCCCVICPSVHVYFLIFGVVWRDSREKNKKLKNLEVDSELKELKIEDYEDKKHALKNHFSLDRDKIEHVVYIGFGACSRVYRIKNKGIDEYFAVKIYKINFDDLEWTQNMNHYEDNCPDHPNIIPRPYFSRIMMVEETFIEGDYWDVLYENPTTLNVPERSRVEKQLTGVIVFKYYDCDLFTFIRKRVRDGNPLSNYEFCRILHQLISAIFCIHSKKIVHRDLHVGNIFMCFEKKEGRELTIDTEAKLEKEEDEYYDLMKIKEVVVADFGFSRHLKDFNDSWIVDKDDPILQDEYYSRALSSEYNEVGNQRSQGPEARMKKDDNPKKTCNFEKSDLFSVGMLALFLCRSHLSKKVFKNRRKLEGSFTKKKGMIESRVIESNMMLDDAGKKDMKIMMKHYEAIGHYIKHKILVEFMFRDSYENAVKKFKEFMERADKKE